jgi:hypothetical protein
MARAFRVGDQAIEEGVVPLLVDQPGARPLQLVAHAAGAPDLHVERLVDSFDRLADRLAEHVNSAARTAPGTARH